MTNRRSSGGWGPLNSVTSILFIILFFVALFYLARGVFWLLSWAAPVFIILTLIIDYKVVVNYGKMIARQFKSNWVLGLALVLLTVLGFPFVSAFLFGKAALTKKISSMMDGASPATKEPEFTEYVEIEEEPEELELKDLQKDEEPSSSYDQFFEGEE